MRRGWVVRRPSVDVKLITEGLRCVVRTNQGRSERTRERRLCRLHHSVAGLLFSYAIHPIGTLLIFEITLPLSSVPLDLPSAHPLSCPLQ